MVSNQKKAAIGQVRARISEAMDMIGFGQCAPVGTSTQSGALLPNSCSSGTSSNMPYTLRAPGQPVDAPTGLATSLADAWQSPAAQTAGEAFDTSVTDCKNAWTNLHTLIEEDERNEPDDVADGTLEARWLDGLGVADAYIFDQTVGDRDWIGELEFYEATHN